jgi:plastocyanin
LTLASVAALALSSCGTGERASSRARAPLTHTVTIEGMRFQPERLRVTAGDIVVWANKDVVPHTSTSSAAGFDSALIEQGASWQLTAKAAGTFEYVCSFHPMMKGTLEVQ